MTTTSKQQHNNLQRPDILNNLQDISHTQKTAFLQQWAMDINAFTGGSFIHILHIVLSGKSGIPRKDFLHTLATCMTIASNGKVASDALVDATEATELYTEALELKQAALSMAATVNFLHFGDDLYLQEAILLAPPEFTAQEDTLINTLLSSSL